MSSKNIAIVFSIAIIGTILFLFWRNDLAIPSLGQWDKKIQNTDDQIYENSQYGFTLSLPKDVKTTEFAEDDGDTILLTATYFK